MNDHLRLWIDALRSEKYKQGMGGLREANDQYCCLGVACEVYRETLGKGNWRFDEKTNRYEFVVQGEFGLDWSSTMTPLRVAMWFCDQEGLCIEIIDELTDDLVLLNDSYCQSFNQIADYLESRFP